MDTALPPGPRYPRPLNILGWVLRPGPFMERCRDQYGEAFTLRVVHEGTWVLMSNPDAVKRPERFLESPPGTYTWIPFGGGIRRCLGASFAQFEMKMVLSAVARHVRLRPSTPAPERVRRRAVTLTPSRGAEVIVDSLNGAGAKPAPATEVAR